MKTKFLKKLFIFFYIISILSFSNYLEAQDNPSLSNQTFYNIREIIENNLILKIESESSILIRGFGNITNSLILRPDIASIQAISNTELSIIALKVGNTIIHVWDGGKLISIRLYVTLKGLRKLKETKEELDSIKRGQPLKVGYVYSLKKIRSKSDYAPYEYKLQDESHAFSMNGDLPYGYFSGNVDYLFRKNQTGLNDDIDYYDAKLENNYFAFSIGDIYPYFTDLTLPLTHIQGMQLSSGSLLDKVKYDVILGSTGFYLWGSRLSSFGQTENRFFGIRTEVFPDENMSFFATALKSENATERKADVARHLGSLGFKYKIGNYLSFELEGARNNKDRTALNSSLKLNIDRASLGITYRDIGVDYLNATGNTRYKGRRGLYTRASIRPLDYLTCSANFDVYQDRLNPDPDSVDKGNRDFEFMTKLLIPFTKTDFLFSLYHKDDRAQQFPVVSLGQRYELRQNLKDIFILGDVSGYIIYNPSRYKSFTTGESNYLDRTLRTGIVIRPFKWLSLTANETWNYREWIVRDYSTSPRRFSTNARIGSRLGKLPISFNANFGYQIDSHVNQDKRSIIVGEDKIRAGGEVKIDLGAYLDAFLRADFARVKGSTDSTIDRFETDITGGVRLLWDTSITLPGHGSVKGMVFKDMNRNGKFDKGDMPVKGAKVYTGAKEYRVTGSGGSFVMGGLPEGRKRVWLDLSTVPETYSGTTPVSSNVVIEKMRTEKVYFGVAPMATIKGTVFNDLNRNKIFDEADEVLPNIMVLLDDGTRAFTDYYGQFAIPHASIGEHKVFLDKDTLKKGLLQDFPHAYTLTVKEGDTKEVSFICYFLRTASGRVYIDKNGNNKFDAEEGLEGVLIKAEDISTTTSEDGYYILRNLPSGEIKLIIDKESLPEGYNVEKDEITIEMKKDTDIRENLDIKIIGRI